MRRACTKLVAKVRSQIRKKSVKGRVACSTELAGCLFVKQVLSPLLVCCRFIRYQSDLPLVSRGFSAASGMRTKCPPELQSGSGRVLDFYTPTRDTLTLSQGGRMSSQGGSLHHSQQCSAPSTRSCALYIGSITVRRACLKLVAKTRRQLRKGSTKCRVVCSMEITPHVLEPLRSSISPARLLPLHSVSKRPSAGLSRLQRRLRHEDEVPSRAAERKRSRSRFLYTNARHFDPQSGRPDVKSRRKPPSFSAMFGAFNALLRAVHWVHHREESMP